MSEEVLAQRIEQRLKQERRSSEHAKLRASEPLNVTPELITSLANKGICSHWAPREVLVSQRCSFNGKPNDCQMSVFEKHAAGWVFTFCPLKK
jgi:ribose 1,5-bisphosphokinase PhnN